MIWADLVSAAAVESPAPQVDVDVLGLCRDHRDVQAGDLFICRRGTDFDSHQVLTEVFAAGAVAALTEEAVTAVGPIWQVTRAEMAHICAAFYGHPSRQLNVFGVTGTDGKTTTVWLATQLLRRAGYEAASLGTLGIWRGSELQPWKFTTPEPDVLQGALASLLEEGVTDVVMEVSSHGLSESRVDGIEFAAVALTTLGRDHLDTYNSLESYHQAKERLFDLQPDSGRQVRPQQFPGRAHCLRGRDFVVNAGVKGALEIHSGSIVRELECPISGEHNLENLETALGLVSRVHPLDNLLRDWTTLTLPPGRWQWFGEGPRRVVVDYAHTPAALAALLKALRPLTEGRLLLCFGCGGGRDAGKRAEMGRVARDGADVVLVTDDNPRQEDPALIRADILKAVPSATEVGDRRKAIWSGIELLRDGDVLVVAGKGHEQGQIIGDVTHPFCDATEVSRALNELSHVA